jgi:hypothetical protein
LVGALLILISLLYNFNLASAIIEVFWILISLWGIVNFDAGFDFVRKDANGLRLSDGFRVYRDHAAKKDLDVILSHSRLMQKDDAQTYYDEFIGPLA